MINKPNLDWGEQQNQRLVAADKWYIQEINALFDRYDHPIPDGQIVEYADQVSRISRIYQEMCVPLPPPPAQSPPSFTQIGEPNMDLAVIGACFVAAAVVFVLLHLIGLY